MEYIKKVDLLEKAVEVEYLNRPRLMVSVATIGKMPSIEAVPMEYHNKVCEEMARRHQAEIKGMVEVVRCQDCKYWTEDRGCLLEDNSTRQANDYCSYGKGADDED